MNEPGFFTVLLTRGFPAVAALLLLASCSTTSLTVSWYDRSYPTDDNKLLADVLIIAMTGDETVRRLYEDSFKETFKAAGVRGVPSYTLKNPDVKPDEEAIAAAVAEAGVSSVLITRHLGTDTRQQYRPPERVSVFADPYYSRISGYYPLVYREMYTPGYSVTVTTVHLESHLYDARSGRLFWAARSESVNPSMTKKYIEELVNVFAKDLRKKGLLE